jgi:phospholipid/cholesterol/gamma-HCH transport system substrate-binding protein
MRSAGERNFVIIGAAGLALTVGLVAGALRFDSLPFIHSQRHYEAYFAEASGLKPGAAVQVSGMQVGEVTGIELAGPRVLISFDVDDNVQLGSRTEAAIKTKSILGAKILEVSPRGDGLLSGPIPADRTTPAYQLPDALGDLAGTVAALDTDQLSTSLQTLAETFQNTPPSVRTAVEGLGRFSQTLNDRDAQLRDLLNNASEATAVLAERSDQVASLIADTNALLAALQIQSAALDQISTGISSLAKQLSGFIADNRAQLRGAVDKLNGVLTIVDNRKHRVQEAIKLANQYAMSLGEAISSGPFFKAYVANLIPGQFLQPFIDVAFSDLGLDPNVLLPSERHDPQTGQPAIPALPVPYPRTGQGGEPHLTLPDAITGNPNDPRYPYREPLPAPPPGGPPPGPPALPAPTPEVAP